MAIRPDTDPKSASPRSGAPSGELEQYGVWVKAEPQDVVEEVALPEGGDLDFDLPVESASVVEESFLSADEEKILDSFDEELDSSAQTSLDELGPLPDIEDMPPLDEELLAPAAEEVSAFDADRIMAQKREEQAKRSSFESINPNVEIDMSSVEGLDGSKPLSSPEQSEIEDVSSEFLEEFAEPQAATSAGAGEEASPSSGMGSGLDDVTAEFLDLGEASGATGPAKKEEMDFEPLDIDLHFEEEPKAGEAEEEGKADFEEVTEFDDFLAEDKGSSAPSKAAFDDVSAVERELSAPTGEEAEAEAKPDLSTEILMKIASELSSIRGELVSLKSQIGDVMVSIDNAPKKKEEEASPEEPESSSGGFFDDEEDETIALTGDELDNILNTADFTTEEAEEPGVLAEGELSPADMEAVLPPDESSLLDETLLPESGDYSAPPASPEPETNEGSAEEAIEELRIGPEEKIEELAVEGPESIDSLGIDLDEGVMPLTPAPEDSSYLEGEEPLALEAELGSADLGDAPLVEPDLTEFDLGPEEFEPRPEIEEELPLAAGESRAEPQEEELEELTLDIDAGSDYAPKSDDGPEEAEFIEPVPEVEEPNFAEISLHEESKSPDLGEVAELENIEELEESDLLAAESRAAQEPLEAEPAAPAAAKAEAPLEEEEDLILEAAEENVEELEEPSFAPSAPSSEEAFAQDLEPAEPMLEPEEEPESPPPPAAKPAPERREAPKADAQKAGDDGDRLKSEIKSVLSYLDKLLDSLPEEKIEEFAKSKYFDTYKKLFEELGLV